MPSSFDLIIGAARDSAAHARADEWLARHPGSSLLRAPDAAHWPFLHPLVPALPETPLVIFAPDVHDACVNHQTQSTRLVTTQLSYLFEVWRTAIAGRDDVLLLATADRDALQQHSPDAIAGRGPFRHASIQVVDHVEGTALAMPRPHGTPKRGALHTPLEGTALAVPPDVPAAPFDNLVRALRATDPAERLTLCVHALDQGRTAPALLATASACMEVNDLDAAARDLDEALALAPDWAAAWFERGKLWLRVDDMERAGAAFREAAERLPGFVSAWANLGATQGELDRAEEALAAFEHARACDPANAQVLNNIGVVSRELGRLPASEAAFRQVISLAPDLAFGYYNLGHTLFLQGRYQAALAAYDDGLRRDAERNPVQATRLALCRLATGDAPAALRDLQQISSSLPREYRRQLLADANAIAWALLTHKPDLPGWKQVNDWLGSELQRLA